MGARRHKACEALGIGTRTLERWRQQHGEGDRRRGPKQEPANKLTSTEQAKLLKVVNSPEFRDLSPKQIVPRLADRGDYIASESTIYRILREKDMIQHREPSRPPRRRPRELVATAPNQVWSWDISYLPGPIRGLFFYLYLVLDVFSRKIVGWEVYERESQDLSANLIKQICDQEGIEPGQLSLHSDNGSPMKGATMLSTLQHLGVMPSFSRPSVSDDNPFSEALFRTVKYRPWYPRHAFDSLEAARSWVRGFEEWYNEEHRHSGINFVTPSSRHAGDDQALLEHRREVYEEARRRHPERWTGDVRGWEWCSEVILNPDAPSLSRKAKTPKERPKKRPEDEQLCLDFTSEQKGEALALLGPVSALA